MGNGQAASKVQREGRDFPDRSREYAHFYDVVTPSKIPFFQLQILKSMSAHGGSLVLDGRSN